MVCALFQIIVLQDQLIREGRIQRDEEMRVFWQEIAKPEVYRNIFGDDEAEGMAEGVGTMSVKTRPTLRGRDGEVTASEVESHGSGKNGRFFLTMYMCMLRLYLQVV